MCRMNDGNMKLIIDKLIEILYIVTKQPKNILYNIIENIINSIKSTPPPSTR